LQLLEKISNFAVRRMDIITLFTDHIRVFVCETTPDINAQRQKLLTVLSRAQIEAITAEPNATEDTVKALMQSCECSLHILGKQDFYNQDGEAFTTDAGLQYRAARSLRQKDFKMFLWNPFGEVNLENKYINDIRRDIVDNTIYNANPSPIFFVEELRSMMSSKSVAQTKIEEKDIFFIYNYLDKETAEGIIGMTEDVLTLSKLAVSMDNYTDYTDYIQKQLPGCKACIIYYDYASEWAVSFARQIWKDNGGKSAKTPILLIGNSAHATSEAHAIFNHVLKTAISEVSLIPLEIKVFYDKVTGKE
jgi:hypothetical protein